MNFPRRLSVLLGVSAFAFSINASAQQAPAPQKAPAAQAAPAPAPAAKPKASGSLEEAYKREFAFLEAEKTSLQQRLGKLEQDAAAKVRAAKQEIERLQNQSLSLSVQADQLGQRLADAERKVDVIDEGSSIVDATLNQASSRLEKGGIKLPEVEETQDKAKAEAARISQVDFAFAKATDLLRDQAQVRTVKGAFFGPDGTKLEGDVVMLGRIASYGVSAQGAGPLAPAGEGRLKIWSVPNGAEAARALLSGSPPNPLPVFLYDSLENSVEPKKGKTLLQTAQAGGVIAWVLLGLGVAVILLAIVRAIILARSATNTEHLVERLAPLVAQGEIQESLEIARKARNAPGRVLKVTLENIKRPREQLDDAISEAVIREEATLDRFGAIILVCAAVGPLLGLLGTVTGMIATFDIITEFGTGNPKLLSGGISEALITTEFGLIVAIPALVLGNLLNGWAERIKNDMEKGALRIGNVANGVQVRDIRLSAIRPKAGQPSARPEAAPVS